MEEETQGHSGDSGEGGCERRTQQLIEKVLCTAEGSHRGEAVCGLGSPGQADTLSLSSDHTL